jgi:hypothetical protein
MTTDTVPWGTEPHNRRWTLILDELPAGRWVLSGAMPGHSWAEAMEIVLAAAETELAGELLGMPGLCPAALGVEGTTVARTTDARGPRDRITLRGKQSPPTSAHVARPPSAGAAIAPTA